MKILIFNSLYYPNIVGGAERSVQILAEGLKQKNINPIVVTTSNKDYVDYINGVKVYYVNTPNLYWMKEAKEQPKWKKPLWHLIDSFNLLAKEKIENILKKEKPDVIHTNNLAGFSVIVWKLVKKFKLPVIHTIRDYYLLCPSSTMFKKGKNCEKQCIRCKIFSFPKKILSNKYVDGAVGISRFILNKHVNLGYFESSEIKKYIPNPISISNIPLKRKLYKEEIVFGFVGLLSPSKGIEFILEHFQKLHLPNVKLFIYGKGVTQDYEKRLKRKYSSSNIVFRGFRDPKEIYTEIDILIVPSLWNEPFGRIVPEAYASGIPVVVSNRGGLPELVEEGKTGFIFDPDKEGDFERKLKELIKIYRSGLFDSDFLKKFAISRFSMEVVVDQYIRIYKAVL